MICGNETIQLGHHKSGKVPSQRRNILQKKESVAILKEIARMKTETLLTGNIAGLHLYISGARAIKP